MRDPHDQSVKERFQQKQINYLVTVRKLDEGINAPQLSVVIDLNRKTTIRRFLQRLGRIVRLTTGKDAIDAVVMQDYKQSTRAELEDAIAFYERVVQEKFSGSRKRIGASRARHDVYLSELGKLIVDQRHFLNELRSTGAERLAQLEALIISQKRLPSQRAKDPEERKLYRWLAPYKKDNPGSWPTVIGLSQEAIQIVEEEGLMIGITAKRVAQLEALIISQKRLPSSTAKDPEERTLYEWLGNYKAADPGTWPTVMGLSQEAIRILEENNLLGQRKKLGLKP